MSMFDKYKILHGLPVEGQKIKFIKHTLSWFTNAMEDEKRLLEVGKEYTVYDTSLNSSSTYVWLKEFMKDGTDKYDNPFFNMSAFDWIKPELNLDDLIGFSPRDLSTLNYTYGYGIEFDNKIWIKGNPIIVVEYVTEGKLDRITRAYFK